MATLFSNKHDDLGFGRVSGTILTFCADMGRKLASLARPKVEVSGKPESSKETEAAPQLTSTSSSVLAENGDPLLGPDGKPLSWRK